MGNTPKVHHQENGQANYIRSKQQNTTQYKKKQTANTGNHVEDPYIEEFILFIPFIGRSRTD